MSSLRENIVPSWLPDWKNKESYKFPESNDVRLWSWEFLRRNPIYQQAWRDHYMDGELRWVPSNQEIQDKEERMRHHNECVRKFNVTIFKDAALEGKIVPMPRENRKEEEAGLLSLHLRDLFTLKSLNLVDPKINQPAPEVLSFNSQYSPTARSYIWHSPNSKEGLYPKKPSEVATVVDLNMPMDHLMKGLRSILEYKKQELLRYDLLEPIDYRFRGKTRALFPNYLRVLDAKTIGTKNTEIAEVLYPEINNDYPEMRSSKKVSDQIRAALSIRDNGYKYICLRAG